MAETGAQKKRVRKRAEKTFFNMIIYIIAYLALIGVGGDERLFGFGCDDLKVNVITTSKEEALTDWEVGETLFFFVGELEDIRQDIDG